MTLMEDKNPGPQVSSRWQVLSEWIVMPGAVPGARQNSSAKLLIGEESGIAVCGLIPGAGCSGKLRAPRPWVNRHDLPQGRRSSLRE
jgi:hypothetical protein